MIHMLAEDLRLAVLKAAFEGKLTKHDTNDTSVYETLKLLNVRTIESEDFDSLPKNWALVSFGDISTYCKTKKKINATMADPNLWMLDLEDIEKGGKLLVKKKVKDKKAIGDKTIFEKGDILYSKLRPYLLKILIADAAGICTPELVPFKMIGNVNSLFTMYYLKSPYVDQKINKETFGVKMPRVGTETMKSLAFPLPPSEEQIRIVTRIEELMKKIDEYEIIENNLVKHQRIFPSEMKASLLQSAMQGILIGKNWNIEDNPEMYTPIWKLTAWDKKFKNVSKNKQKETRKYHYYLASEMKAVEKPTGDVFLLSTGDYSGWTTEETVGDTLCEGEIVSIPWGGYPNVKYYKGKFITSDNRIATSTDLGILSNRYLYYFMLSQVDYLDSIYRGTGLRHPDMSAVLEMLIPLPSVLEQELIVKKLDLLLPMCESLETK